MKENILIISRIFSPDNTVGAIRPTKLTKYLSRSEYKVDVISSKDRKYNVDQILVKDTRSMDNITRISNSKFYLKIRSFFYPTTNKNAVGVLSSEKVPKSKFNNFFLNWLKEFIKYFILILDEVDLYQQFKKENINIEEYSYVYSTYSTFANHLIASYIKRKQRNIKWIADFRDPVFVDTVPFGFRRYTKNFTRKYVKNADAITAVSEGTLESLYIKDYTGIKRVITNGFDREDLSFEIENILFDKFTFTYTGQLYGGKRDLSILFKVLRELIDTNKISESDLQFCYAGGSLGDLSTQASRYKLESIIVNRGYIKRIDAIELQRKSHILVLASWNKKYNTGVITGKLLEYMMIEKPVVSLINGDIANSKIKEIVDRCNLGVVYEEANHDVDYKLIKEYILEQYNKFKQTGNVIHYPLQEEIERYSYREITNQLIKLMKEID